MVARAAKLTKEQGLQLKAALAAVPARTSARLALNVVYISDKYPLYPLIYGALVGVGVLGVLAIFWPELSLRLGFYGAAGATIVTTALLDWMPLRLKLIPKGAKFWECWELAHRSFAARVLAQNERKTGILLFVSLGEHYVEVVTDRDVDRHIPQSVWDAIIGDFAVAARQHRIGEGLIAMVGAATKVLEEQYPAKPIT